MSTTDDFTALAQQAWQRRQQYNQQAAAYNQQQLAATSSIADTWPQMDPGLVLPLGKSGLMGDHPVVQHAAATSVAQKANSGQVAPTGTQVTGQALKKSHRSVFGSIGHFLSDLNPLNAGQTVTQAAVNHPTLAKAGEPIATVGHTLTSNQVAKDLNTGAKAATRVGTAALTLPADLIQGAYRGMRFLADPAGSISADQIPNLNDLITQTQIGSIIENGVTSGDTGGSGFFFNPKSTAGQAQSQAARAFGTVNGHALTVGRGTAAIVTEPGTRSYNILSGLLDADVQLVGGKPASAVGAAMRGRKVLAGGEDTYVVTHEGEVVLAADAAQAAKETLAAQRAAAAAIAAHKEALAHYNHVSAEADRISLSARGLAAQAIPRVPGVDRQMLIVGRARYEKELTSNARAVEREAAARLRDAAEKVRALGAKDTLSATGIPTNITGGVSYALGKKGRIERLGADYGLVNGLRKTVLPEKAVTWLNSNAGQRFASFAANTKSFNDIWDATGRKLPVDVVNALVDAKDPVQVKQILAGELGTSLREAPSVSAAQATAAQGGVPGIIGQAGLAVRRARQSSAFTLLPHQSLDLTDPDRAVEDFDRFQRITKAFTQEQISENNAKLAKALTGAGGEGAALQAVLHVTDVVGQTMKTMGVNTDVVNKAVRSWRNTIQDLRHFNVNDIGENVDFPGVVVADNGLPAPSPHLFVEYLHNNIPLPNVRDIRTAVSKTRRITNSAPAHLVQDASDFINNQIFKPWVLLRGAWPLRVLGEEQARMGAAGYSSFLKDPASYLALLVGSEMPRTNALLQKMGKDALTTDVKGTKWADLADEAFSGDANEYAQSLSRRGAGYNTSPSSGIITRHYPTFTKNVDPGFTTAWADELRKLNVDPVSRRIAQALDSNIPAPAAMDDTTAWLWNGTGAGIRNDLAARWAAGQARRLLPANNNPFLDRQQLQTWVQSVYDRIITKTSGHPQLVNAAATGKIVGKRLVSGGDVNPKAVETLAGYTDHAPQVVTGPMRVFTRGNTAGSQVAASYKKAVELGFEWLMSKPSNTLSRSPVFKQAYYQRIGELAPYMEAKATAKAAKAADEASASKAAASLRAGGKGKLTLDDADTIAKKYALDQVSTLLYGESKRSNFFDAYRILFPFGDAFREVVTRWAKLASQNPAVPLRAAQIVNGARQSGFFYTDPQTGKESFVYPGSQQLTQLLTGVPVKFVGQASGLNMVSASLLPGFGPAVQIAAGQLIPDTGTTKGLRDFLMPYGPGDTSGGVFDQVSSIFVPAWLKKFQTASTMATPQQQRQLISTTNQVAAYLYSTGKYDISTPDGQQKLISDAKQKAKWIWRLRGMAQFGAPAAPEPEISAKDKDGVLHTIYALQSAYRDLQTKDPANATADFMQQYGELALMATNPTTSGNFAPTTSLYDFVNANPDLVKKYPTLYGYFAPAGGQFSQPEYQRQLASGERVGVGAQQNVDITNQRMATAIYNHLKSEVAGRTDQAASQWLSAAREKLAAMYPQFGLKNNPPDQGTVAQQVQRMQIAVKDPQVLSTEAGKGLALYMAARDKAMQAAKAAGLASFATAKSAAGIRQWLQGVAAQISAAYPDFDTVYTRVLAYEMSGASS